MAVALTYRKLASQAEVCERVLERILHESFIKRRPADRALAHIFRNDPRLGSRDRQLISECVFSVFRWWGWVSKLLPRSLRESLANPPPPAPRPAVAEPEDAAAAACESLEREEQADDDEGCVVLPQGIGPLILLCALTLDRREPFAAAVWAGRLGFGEDSIRKLLAHEDPERRITEFLKALPSNVLKSFTPPHGFSSSELVPAWLEAELSPSVDIVRLTEWSQKRPPMWLRAQTPDVDGLIKKLASDGLEAIQHPSVAGALRIDKARVNLYSLESYRNGLFEVQDLASQVIGLVCAPSPGGRWWDACAGAGGKSLHLASLMNRTGTVLSSDIREYKLKDLRIRARRASFPNIVCKPWDGKGIRGGKRQSFDGVLADAPCTCSGTWRRNPDARWTTTVKTIADMASIQMKILQNAATGVQDGGVLVYATCSVLRRENDATVEWFLKNNTNFILEPFVNPLTGAQTDGTLQVLPWDADCDAMFVARFRRK